MICNIVATVGAADGGRVGPVQFRTRRTDPAQLEVARLLGWSRLGEAKRRGPVAPVEFGGIERRIDVVRRNTEHVGLGERWLIGIDGVTELGDAEAEEVPVDIDALGKFQLELLISEGSQCLPLRLDATGQSAGTDDCTLQPEDVIGVELRLVTPADGVDEVLLGRQHQIERRLGKRLESHDLLRLLPFTRTHEVSNLHDEFSVEGDGVHRQYRGCTSLNLERVRTHDAIDQQLVAGDRRSVGARLAPHQNTSEVLL